MTITTTTCEHDCFRCATDQLADSMRDLFIEMVAPIVERIPFLKPRPWVHEHVRKQQHLNQLVALGLSGHEAREAVHLDAADRQIFVQALMLGASTGEAWDEVAAAWRDLTPDSARWTPGEAPLPASDEETG